jgi:hypothetical protein
VAKLVDKSRAQVIRTDRMFSDLVQKVETTSDAVQRGVLAPIQEVSAIMKGMQAGLEFLFSRYASRGDNPLIIVPESFVLKGC